MTEAEKDPRFMEEREKQSQTAEAPPRLTCPVCGDGYGTMDRQEYRGQLLCWSCTGRAYYLEALSIGMHQEKIEPRYEHVRALVVRIEALRRVMLHVHQDMARVAMYADVPL